MNIDDPSTLQWRPASPWATPVPLAAADFEPLHAAHQPWCLRTDLGAVQPFGVAGFDDGDLTVGFADFQLPARYPVARRLGSGRAVFHEGKYIKGVGRTQLAANWADASDVLHSSGHMYPSGAIREYLVTCYLQARGLGHVVVPCEGLALRPLPTEFGGALRAHAKQLGVALAPADACMQALTFKPGNFARWSNFSWLATHAYGELDEVIRMGLALQHFSDPSAPIDTDACTPSAIAAGLDAAVARTRNNFGEFFTAGIYWGSFTNNATLDGRFLDLELPTFLAEPMVVALAPHKQGAGLSSAAGPIYQWFGAEVIDAAASLAACVAIMSSRLSEMAARCVHPSAAAFCRATVEALAQTFGPAHWIHDREQWRRDLLDRFQGVVGCPYNPEPLVEALLGERSVNMALRRHELGLADPEPAISVATFFADEASLPTDADGARALMNGLARELDQCTSVSELLRGLRGASDRIQASVRPRARRGAAA
ncbi:hypothetical protein DB30_02678 [Enhygromyxa salina]|uniref:Uncharacterized protein n=1 Tax=Enhygromyxa salina TaxID=215803 RepID=A0A0C2DIA7_9BACT|nr:hypothetical protein [Enhygromyxa salina]KIG19397.1 hypothetical protein DB30_02678 [Enhygromyxa salina]